MKNNHVIAAASYYNKKVFFDKSCEGISKSIEAEIRSLCSTGAEMTEGIFQICYTDEGNIIFSAVGSQDDFNYDEIGARLIVDKLLKENSELVKSIQLWHALYKTEHGKKLKEKIIDKGILS